MALDVVATADLEALKKGLQDIGDKIKAPHRLHVLIAGYLNKKTQERFAKQISPWGGAWKPSARVLGGRERRAAKLAAGKKVTGGVGRTLVDTGRLRQSFAINAQRGNVFFGQRSNVKYFTYHQWGTKRMVARPMMPLAGTWDAPILSLPRDYEDEIGKLIEDWGRGVF